MVIKIWREEELTSSQLFVNGRTVKELLVEELEEMGEHFDPSPLVRRNFSLAESSRGGVWE